MKKLMALVLSVSMVLCAVPAFAFADAAGTETTPPAEKPAYSLSDTKVDEIEAQVYTGEEIKIEQEKIVVKTLSGETLTAGKDYEMAEYKNNVNAGIAEIVLKGKGSYGGTKTVIFEILPKKLAAEEVEITIPNQMKDEKNGKDAVIANASVTWNGKVIDPKDYKVIGDNSKAGTSTAEISFISPNFAGTANMTYNYNVVSMNLADVAMYLTEPNAKYTYSGEAYTPAVKLVADGSKTLTEGTDYYVSYADNVNAGTAVIRVTGMGLYAGTQTKNFTIAKADLSDADVVFVKDAYTATGSPIKPEADKDFKVSLNGREISKEQYIVEYADNIAVGKAKLTVKPAVKDPINFSGSKTAEFTIAGKTVSDLTITLEKNVYDYDGTAKEPAAVVKDGDKTLVKDTDYTVAYKDNVYAGTASAVITGKGNYAGTTAVNFTIKGKEAVISTDQDSYVKYVQTSKPFTLNASSTGDATGLTFESGDESILTVDASGMVTLKANGKTTITIRTVGSKEYTPAEKVVTVTVKPVKPVFKLSSPEKKQVKVLITKVKDATGYQVKYGRMGKYYTKNVKHLENEFSRTYTYLNRRTSGKTYFIKVRAYKEMPDGTTVYGNWTSVKKIKSK